ncbi:LysR family transcriptional regulator [Roseovarius pacificus]|uniref:LysR family transcriptional regulator n=1 Tax=Roseovarius pacificus TaxID=337701 RepID=UPI0040390F25
MNYKLDWSDYEIVLRIAEAGSLSKAAHVAGSSHPTMFRKINAVEKKLGVRLFDRFRTGYRMTVAGEEVVSAARRIAEIANEAERRVSGRDLRPSGVVRIATTDSLHAALLAPEIARFRMLQPDIILDVALSNEISDLALREADIAIRPASRPADHLVGRKLGTIRQAVYAHPSLDVGNRHRPSWESLPWVGPGSSMGYEQLHAWMSSAGCDDGCVCRVDSVAGMHAVVRSGIGVAVLPCYLADADTDLVRLGDPIEDVAVDLWLLTHPDLRDTARIRAVLDHFGQRGTLL